MGKNHQPDTRTCHDPGVAQTLFAASTYSIQVCEVSQSVHRLYTFVLRMIRCANLFV